MKPQRQLDGASAVAGLQSAGRNTNLNAAFESPWAPMMNSAMVPQGDTRFDPFMGTGWDHWLDMAGAKNPGGVRMGGQIGNRAIGGLQQARPTAPQPTREQEIQAYWASQRAPEGQR